MALRSLSGYGAGQARCAWGILVAEVRVVNHRFFDARIRFPSSLSSQAHRVETILKKRLVRGRAEASLRLEASQKGSALGDDAAASNDVPEAATGSAATSNVPQSGPVLDLRRAHSALQQLSRLRDEWAPEAPLPLSLLTAVPGLWVDVQDELTVDSEAVGSAFEAACDAAETMREREGVQLAADLSARLDKLEQHREQIEQLAVAEPDRIRERIHERISTVLSGNSNSSSSLDRQRLEQEVAILADRADVSEELVRLESHCKQAETLLKDPQAPVGRRLDFLAQEMNREANTIGSKVLETTASGLVIELKADIERIREQVQNIL